MPEVKKFWREHTQKSMKPENVLPSTVIHALKGPLAFQLQYVLSSMQINSGH